ncbi:endonuclease/exonuclease/phosphatase family protein [Arenibacterium sp. CAU 1754]
MAFYHGLKSYADDPDYPDKQKWIASRLLTLRRDLNTHIVSERQPNSLIVGSWNIRAFDDGMLRLDESYHYIAEIVDKFDICAIQEVKSSLKPLERLVKLLGPHWEYFVSDVSSHKGGNSERMAFVYNTDKVIFRHLIGEIVLPREDLINGEQIARSPFFAAFQAGWFRFALCSTHIIFGGTTVQEKELRVGEIRAITKTLVKRAQDEDQVYVFLGDMNIDEPDGAIMKALKDSKMCVPSFPPTNLGGDKYYDQIAFTVKGKAELKTRLIRHGCFDWRRAVFGPYPDDAFPPQSEGEATSPTRRIPDSEQLAHYEPVNIKQRAMAGKDPYKNWASSYRTWTTYEMSDHLPIWIEIEIDYSDDYIARYL